ARQSCRTTSRPARELRLLRWFESGLFATTRFQIIDGVEAAIEQLLLATLARHAFTQGCRRRRVDRRFVLQHDAVATRAIYRDEPRFDIELHERRIALQRIAATATAPCVGQQQITRFDFDAIDLRREQLLAAIRADQRLLAALTRQSAVHAPRVREPAIVVN